MKRIFLLSCLFFIALMTFAQRAAVLEFKAGVGISQADVDGISAIFITYFRPEGYTMVERTQIDKVIDEQGFQRGRLSEDQMVRIGKILNVSKVIVGDINVVMGQYNVDVRAINVESGTIAATEGAAFQAETFRDTMKSIAQKLASEISINSKPSISEEYVDLGLPSGTLWKKTNEPKFMQSWGMGDISSQLPSNRHWEELIENCQWSWTGLGFKITGPNGNTISLPAAGYNKEGKLSSVGSAGYYWTSESSNERGRYFIKVYPDRDDETKAFLKTHRTKYYELDCGTYEYIYLPVRLIKM